MWSRLKQYILIAIGIGVFYFLLTHHFVFLSVKDFELLKKVEPTLEYTFFSLRQSQPATILRIDALRNAGIENIMLERGLITEPRLDQILDMIDKELEKQQK